MSDAESRIEYPVGRGREISEDAVKLDASRVKNKVIWTSGYFLGKFLGRVQSAN